VNETVIDALARLRRLARSYEGSDGQTLAATAAMQRVDDVAGGFAAKMANMQAVHLAEDLADESRRDVHESWFREDSANFWRLHRMYEPVFECLARTKSEKWLVVGDGRYGTDSVYMRRRGFQDVLPTDIGEALLLESKRRGMIDDYSVENAEALSFADDSFDYVLCKESYHHFARPMVALYEMLRVARKGVVLIEPQDLMIDQPHAQGRVPADYEPSGNYVYSISQRELEKVCLGVDMPVAAFKGINDHFVEGGHLEPADDSSAIFREIRNTIAAIDALCAEGRAKHRLLMAVLFKVEPSAEIRRDFERRGWLIRDLERNPHLSSSSKA
jgi:SAM-dependent methyltransferase